MNQFIEGDTVRLASGPYKGLLWGDRVRLEDFTVTLVDGDTVHCYSHPYRFEWPAKDLVFAHARRDDDDDESDE